MFWWDMAYYYRDSRRGRNKDYSRLGNYSRTKSDRESISEPIHLASMMDPLKNHYSDVRDEGTSVKDTTSTDEREVNESGAKRKEITDNDMDGDIVVDKKKKKK